MSSTLAWGTRASLSASAARNRRFGTMLAIAANNAASKWSVRKGEPNGRVQTVSDMLAFAVSWYRFSSCIVSSRSRHVGPNVTLICFGERAMFDGDLGSALLAVAQRHPERPALWVRGQRLNYAELFENAARL